VLLINNETASRVLEIDECIEVVETAFREEGLGRAVNRTKSQMHLPTSSDERWYRFSSVEGGLRHAGVVALRIKSDVLCWPESFGQSRNFYYCMEPERYCGLILLFKAENGEPLALMNDGVIQHMRVGATAAVAAKRMAREDASVVGLLGSGGMAEAHLRAYTTVRPVKLARVFSPHREHREQFAARMAKELAIEVVPTNEAHDAVHNADIVATCTDTGEPILFAEWLEPGMHVTSVNHREADAAVYGRLDRYVKYQSGLVANYFTTPEDWRPRSLGGGGLEQERLLRSSPAAKQELTELLVQQAPGRESRDEINFFKSEGTGVQFAAVSDLAYRKCHEQNLGQPLPLDWFIQKIRN
jgi:ornithine cyclodeaminase/alanine dehydrogenase-like protein (mu-crystallin family)